MPSAQSKLEKQTSTEVLDPSKQIITLVEKKVRNLEKRKSKLDNYRNESKAGKELNEDQKNAITKYDNVVELLEMVKDLQKQFTAIQQDTLRGQKKQAKKEQIERQQNDIRRLQEIFVLQDLISKFSKEEIRQDLLSGSNGATPLPQETLDQLQKFAKLLEPKEGDTDADTKSRLAAAAEHLYMLVEARSKEVVGTTYKQLKEALTSVLESGYLSPKVEEEEEAPVEEEPQEIPAADSSIEPSPSPEVVAPKEEEKPMEAAAPEVSSPAVAEPYYPPVVAQQPLQEVLPVSGNFNFLQESRIELEPHLDPAIVAAQPMYHPPIPAASGEPAAKPPLAPEYDPATPIPTQTFTNQNFALHLPLTPAVVPGNLVIPLGIIPPPLVADPATAALDSQPPTVPLPAATEQPPAAPSEEVYNKPQDEGNGYRGGNMSNGRGMRPMSRGGRGAATNGFSKPPRGGGANAKVASGNCQGAGYYQQQPPPPQQGGGYNRENYYGNYNKRGGGPPTTAPQRGASRGGGPQPPRNNNRNFRQ